MIEYVYDDGGRSGAGFKGKTGDCVTRAIAIATGFPYSEVYDDLFECSRIYGYKRRDRYARGIQNRGASPRGGVYRVIYHPYLLALGFTWHATMGIGTGCQVHLRSDELPGGTLITRLSGHVAAVIDGVLHDTHDCSRDGMRCVYGYYLKNDDRRSTP